MRYIHILLQSNAQNISVQRHWIVLISSRHVTLHVTLYRNCSPLTHVCFQDPYFISIASLFSILTLTLDYILGTPYAMPDLPCSMPTPHPCPLPIHAHSPSMPTPHPCPLPIHAHSPSTLTEDSVIPSWTYSSPCCTCDSA